MNNPEFVLENETHKLHWDFGIKMDHLILIWPNNSQQKKKRTCWIVNFAVLANHRVKFKETEKKDKYLDLAWKLKKLGNLKVTEIPIVIGALGIVTKG